MSLRCRITRDGERLVWTVTNVSSAPVWAFLLVPSFEDGVSSFAKDSAWFAREGETIVARKVDAEPPSDRHVELVPSGAIELAPGERREGSLSIAEEIICGEPYGEIVRVRPSVIVLEVGWLPVREGQILERLEWAGVPFAYLRTWDDADAQRFVRSAPLRWEP